MATLERVIPATYLPGKHVHADLSDYGPGEEGHVRCLKCLALRYFKVGPRGGISFGPWERGYDRVPRCPSV